MVCTKRGGSEPSTMAITVDPTGTPGWKYVPFTSVVKVKGRPALSIIATLTPSMPGSPASWTPLLFRSSNTVPLIPPSGVGVGDFVGGAVGGVMTWVGDLVGGSLGKELGDSDGDTLGLGDGVGTKESREML
jgi:hypothetical protein